MCGYIISTAAGRIKAIYQRSGSKLTRSSQLYLKLAMFYRPEDTHRGAAAGRESDLCLLYWGDEGETLIPQLHHNYVMFRHYDVIGPNSPPSQRRRWRGRWCVGGVRWCVRR